MIPQAAITYWSRIVPWPSRDQVEQDLVLSRLICEIANHPILGDELVLRGGTCLHKVHLQRPLRYMGVDPDDILTCFTPYRPDGYTTATAVANLQEHAADRGFREDLLDLVAEEAGFDVDGAARLVTDELLRRL